MVAPEPRPPGAVHVGKGEGVTGAASKHAEMAQGVQEEKGHTAGAEVW